MKAVLNILIVAILGMSSTSVFAGNCTALGNGDWSDPSNWSCGTVPGCGDVITIPAGITVKLDFQLDINESNGCNTPTQILVYGTLKMQTGKKMYLACGSTIVIFTGGQLVEGSGGGMSNLIEICGANVWTAGDGTIDGYVLLGGPIALGVDFLSFNAAIQGANQVAFDWTVLAEENVDYYEIYASNDGVNWLPVNRTEGTGRNTQITYNAEASWNEGGEVYFKIASIDNDGTRNEYNKIVRVQFENSIELMVYPNPVSENSSITVSTSATTNTLYIIDQSGRAIGTFDTENGKAQIPTIGFNKGIYVVRDLDGNQTKFVVQ